jgi:hypothetical protein
MEEKEFFAQRKKAIDTVDDLLADIERTAKRGIAVFGPVDFLRSILPSFIGHEAFKPITFEVFPGERRDLKVLMGCRDWVSTALAISAAARRGEGSIFKPGDYFRLPIKVKSGSFDGLEFESLDIPETELVFVQATRDGKIIFNFEEILFYSAINAKSTNKGGFKESALCKYLNNNFLEALDRIRGVLQKNKDGNMVTLPTLFEVCGSDCDNENVDCNWEEEPRQLEYFKNIKNRIRVKDNDTHWWWLSTASAAPDFAGVGSYGYADSYGASDTDGGVAPAICIS